MRFSCFFILALAPSRKDLPIDANFIRLQPCRPAERNGGALCEPVGASKLDEDEIAVERMCQCVATDDPRLKEK